MHVHYSSPYKFLTADLNKSSRQYICKVREQSEYIWVCTSVWISSWLVICEPCVAVNSVQSLSKLCPAITSRKCPCCIESALYRPDPRVWKREALQITANRARNRVSFGDKGVYWRPENRVEALWVCVLGNSWKSSLRYSCSVQIRFIIGLSPPCKGWEPPGWNAI